MLRGLRWKCQPPPPPARKRKSATALGMGEDRSWEMGTLLQNPVLRGPQIDKPEIAVHFRSIRFPKCFYLTLYFKACFFFNPLRIHTRRATRILSCTFHHCVLSSSIFPIFVFFSTTKNTHSNILILEFIKGSSNSFMCTFHLGMRVEPFSLIVACARLPLITAKKTQFLRLCSTMQKILIRERKILVLW